MSSELHTSLWFSSAKKIDWHAMASVQNEILLRNGEQRERFFANAQLIFDAIFRPKLLNSRWENSILSSIAVASVHKCATI